MSERVAIFGGGVAGLSAAHELAERGFEVDVYEARADAGGKSRSQYVAGTGTSGRKDLPGEHGFRFFPAFYKHVVDTMARIPFGERTVADNLLPSSEAGLGRRGDDPVYRFLRRLPNHPREMADALLGTFKKLGFSQLDTLQFTERMLRYFTSCKRRRLEQYEKISWWSFLGGDRYSEAFRRYLLCIPRIMVAMDPRLGSARTIGDISMQLTVDYGGDGESVDRLLNGPTTEKWIAPWRAHLEELGVRFHLGKPLRALAMDAGRITGATVGSDEQVRADFYLSAVPLEALRPLITESMAEADPSLSKLSKLPGPQFSRLTSWMVGIQFYLRKDVPMVPGHCFYPDAPWGMTSVSQPQFWREDGALEARYGDGQTRGLISIDLSDWNTPGTFVKKPARLCTRDEVARETWEQLKAAVNSREGVVLADEDLVSWHLDDDLEPLEGRGFRNTSQLLVHPPGSWELRPEAVTQIDNLVLAGDFVRTHTDLASMEGANEAARRAVNGILERSSRALAPCEVWAMEEPALFQPAQKLDEALYGSRFTGGRHAFDLLPSPVDSASALSRAMGTLLEGGRRGLALARLAA
jgi:uncharacterized protein with NAD-binding domain and iron-sulfur cluster